MTDVFRGVAGALNRVFGASLRYVSQRGFHQDIHSVFRETPIVVAADDGKEGRVKHAVAVEERDCPDAVRMVVVGAVGFVAETGAEGMK